MAVAVAEVDVAEVIDRHRVSSFQIRIMLLCCLVQFFEGFDQLMLAYTAPALSHEWHIHRHALGPVFAASLAGMSIGTVVLSPIADWIGRKKLVILAVLIFGGLTLVTSQVQTLQQLRVLRFIAGFGLAAAVPSTVVLVNEYAPRQHRGAMVMAMSVGVAVGAACGGQLAAFIVPAHGWRTMFLIGGIAPLLLVPALLLWLPESIRFLTVKGGREQQIKKILRQFDPAMAVPANPQFTIHHRVQRSGLRVAELFTDGHLPTTLLLWFSFATSLIVLNFLNNWLPSVLSEAGLPVAEALRITTEFQLGGIVGVFGLGFLFDRFGFLRVLVCAFLLEAVFITTIGWSDGSVPVLVLAVPLVGMCIIGVNNGLMALAATLYPTAIRATGASWAHGFGRFGGIFGPIIGGILLEMHWSLQEVFAVGALFPVCGALMIGTMAYLRSHAPRPERVQPAVQPGQ